jgi:hypothetical protein
MEDGDLGTWVDHSQIIILEGVLAQIPPSETVKSGVLGRHKTTMWAPADQWGWSRMAMRVINDRAHRLSLPIAVVTFISQDVADSAADWLERYAVSVSETAFMEFDLFCESLAWRPNVHSVIDTDPERLRHYGIRAYQAAWGAEF